MRKLAVTTLVITLVLVLLAPFGMYLVGLGNIEGRPIPPTSTTNAVENGIELQRALRLKTPIVVRPSNPWIYVGQILDDQGRLFIPDAGTYAASLVARTFNRNHLKNRQMLWWHLSGAALTIWITRNWRTDEIVSAAAETLRCSSPGAQNRQLGDIHRQVCPP